MAHLKQFLNKTFRKGIFTHPISIIVLFNILLLFNSSLLEAETRTKEIVGEVVKQIRRDDEQKLENKSIRPDEWSGPTKVHFIAFILDIDSVDSTNQNFEANVYIRLRWKDKRLVSSDGVIRRIEIDDIWNPRLLITNQKGILSTALP